MQELTLNEIHHVSGAGLVSFLSDVVMSGSAGVIGGLAAVKYLSIGTAIPPYIDVLPREVLAITGFVACATAIYTMTHQGSSSGNSSYSF